MPHSLARLLVGQTFFWYHPVEKLHLKIFFFLDSKKNDHITINNSTKREIRGDTTIERKLATSIIWGPQRLNQAQLHINLRSNPVKKRNRLTTKSWNSNTGERVLNSCIRPYLYTLYREVRGSNLVEGKNWVLILLCRSLFLMI